MYPGDTSSATLLDFQNSSNVSSIKNVSSISKIESSRNQSNMGVGSTQQSSQNAKSPYNLQPTRGPQHQRKVESARRL